MDVTEKIVLMSDEKYRSFRRLADAKREVIKDFSSTLDRLI